MERASNSGNIRDVASWALQVTGAKRTVFISGLQRPAPTLAEQLRLVLARMDEMLSQAGMSHQNVVWWDCTCDPSVSDQQFNETVMPALTDYFRELPIKPAAATVRFARVLGGRLVELELIAMD